MSYRNNWSIHNNAGMKFAEWWNMQTISLIPCIVIISMHTTYLHRKTNRCYIIITMFIVLLLLMNGTSAVYSLSLQILSIK